MPLQITLIINRSKPLKENLANIVYNIKYVFTCDTVNFQVDYSWFEFIVFLLTKAKEPNLVYYLLIAMGGKIDRFMLFPRALAGGVPVVACWLMC